MAIPYQLAGSIGETGTYLRQDLGYFRNLNIELIHGRVTAVVSLTEKPAAAPIIVHFEMAISPSEFRVSHIFCQAFTKSGSERCPPLAINKGWNLSNV
jgi:hypothetical protein